MKNKDDRFSLTTRDFRLFLQFLSRCAIAEALPPYHAGGPGSPPNPTPYIITGERYERLHQLMPALFWRNFLGRF